MSEPKPETYQYAEFEEPLPPSPLLRAAASVWFGYAIAAGVMINDQGMNHAINRVEAATEAPWHAVGGLGAAAVCIGQVVLENHSGDRELQHNLASSRPCDVMEYEAEAMDVAVSFALGGEIEDGEGIEPWSDRVSMLILVYSMRSLEADWRRAGRRK